MDIQTLQAPTDVAAAGPLEVECMCGGVLGKVHIARADESASYVVRDGVAHIVSLTGARFVPSDPDYGV